MTRELKFRSWDGTRMHKAFDLTQNAVFWWEDHYDYPLMQYTGLKDKNGVEIYEGDIVKSRSADYKKEIFYDEIETIVFKNGQFKTDSLFGSTLAFGSAEFEVIGNIYENPELLGGEVQD